MFLMRSKYGDICESDGLRTHWVSVVFAAIILSTAWLIYQPGVSGAFLFDDYSNLPPLGDYGPIHTMWQAIAWITSGFSGPTGRPVSLASFLIDAREWPASPEGFKSTNIIIHLVTGAILGGLIRSLALAMGVSARLAIWVGTLGAGFWLLHPLWVSTVLYVVQRMAMLAALFTFAGLWSYVHGRLILVQAGRKTGYIWMSLGLVLGTLLAVLSKENGALLPLLAWIIDVYVFRSNGFAKEGASFCFAWWRRIFIIVPSLLVVGYLISRIPVLFTDWNYGNFTPWERLLTEGRVVWTYLSELWWPGTQDGGLFNDDIIVSTSLLHPFSTLLSFVGLGFLLFISVRWRRSANLAVRASGLSILFFFAGHLLESTWLPLELYFEHRNYLPAGLMFFPLSIFLVEQASQYRRWAIWSGAAIIICLALFTLKRADVWGKPFQQALTWAHEHPNSARAQSYLANFWEHTGNYREAEKLLDNALKQHPQDLLVMANRALLACDTGYAPTDLGSDLLKLAHEGQLAQNVVSYQFDTFLSRLQSNCTVFGADFALKLINTALTNPLVQQAPTEHRSLLHRRATLWLERNEVTRAYTDLLTALQLPDLAPGTRLLFAAELASAQHQRLALSLLDTVRPPLDVIKGWSIGDIHDRWLAHIGYYQNAERHLRDTLESELADGGK